MLNSIHISFQLKKSKTNRKSLAPINLRITINGKRAELSTHRRLNPDNWDNNYGRLVRNIPIAISIYNHQRPHRSIDYLIPIEAHFRSGKLK